MIHLGSEDNGPPWLRPFLMTSFFDSCEIHGDPTKSQCNIYCLDCMKVSHVHFGDRIAILGIYYFVLIISCLMGWEMGGGARGEEFNVLDFKAAGDGVTNDTQAFVDAWAAACWTTTADSPTIVIPQQKTFLVYPTIFQGLCKTSNISVNIYGTLIAPDDPKTWDGQDASLWLRFDSIYGLTIDGFGQGQIFGRGYNWWNQSCKLNPKEGCTTLAPTAIKIIGCNNSQVRGLSFVDNPQGHLSFLGCHGVVVNNLNIKAPEKSPNSDGIHLQACENVWITETIIGTGDDCISIGDHTRDVNVMDVTCGPGHGISVGSLGRGGSNVSVEDIHVSYVNMFNTTNGARIKTWQGATGFARNISYRYINFTNVQNPIIIDQYYCDVRGHCPAQENNVQVSNVTFAYISGTSMTQTAVVLNCSQSVPCIGIELDTVNLTAVPSSHETRTSCINARGSTRGYVHPSMQCLDQ